jgi:beta-glucosidase
VRALSQVPGIGGDASTSVVASHRGTSAHPDLAEAPEFPEGFLWGAATAAYQVEGATDEDGRSPSIWDTFCRTPGRVHGGDTGDTAADHYHRMPDDVALMRDLGLRSYRFSVAWPRVQPDGRGPSNATGLDFYRRLVDALLEAGITPFVTLYHWDLPQRLQDEGGWPSRDVAYRFADYAAIVFGALGDRVVHWTTINEPWCVAFVGYGEGRHAPGIQDPRLAVRAAHHLLLGHGLAVRSMRASGPADRMFGIVLNPAPVHAASDSDVDRDAARRMDGAMNRTFLDPLLKGSYPEDVLADFAESVDLAHLRAGDGAIIATPIDLLGINYYRPYVVARIGAPGEPADGRRDDARYARQSGWPGAERVAVVGRDLPRTAMGWEVDPSGLTELLVRVHGSYPPIPLFVTENGAAYDDRPAMDGAVHDPDRIDYLRRHMIAARGAIGSGVDLRGYFVWTLLDNFEWAEGYSHRFGIVYVDHGTQRRIPKDSAAWYRAVIAANGPVAPADGR